jgi:hypothetical protein
VRPTVSEQLAGMRRVLREVIGPEVTSAYPADMLRGMLATLEMLERSWARVAPFLSWDNAATEQLLRAGLPHVTAPIAAQIRATLSEPAPDPLDVDALDRRNTELRRLLSAVVPMLAVRADAAAAYRDVRAHLRERMDRFPLSTSAPMPGAAR